MSTVPTNGPSFNYSPYALKDAEAYLETVGITGDPKLVITPNGGLQALGVQYNDGKEGKESRGRLNGMDFQYEKKEDLFIQQKPDIFLCNIFKDTTSVLLMVDPDAPERAGANKAGEKGPRFLR